MKISFNPSNSNKNILDLIKNNKDIIFDLKGHSIFARGVEFKGTDTNTWRDIKINNVSIGSHTLDLQNGSNTTLTNTNGVVTINSTWRPVVDNLTSDSTTSSLSAKQGKVLKALIDGKSNLGHTHDGRYVRYYSVTTLDCNNLAAGLTAARISATNAAHTNHSAYLYISDVGTPFQIQIPDSSIPYIYKRYYGSGKWSGWFKLNAGYADSAGSVAWANVTGKPSSYTPSTHTHGLLHSDLTVTLANTTTDSGWSMINSSYNGFLLKSIHTQVSAPNWIENNYAAGICFGGSDTKGVVSVAYYRPYIKFAGGNGSKPVWWIRLSGISGATYNLANFNADTLDDVHLNGIFTGFSYEQSRLTATIGTVSKTVNVTGSYPSIGSIESVNMNTIASYGNCMGMAYLASSNSGVNPNNQTSWHHFINMSYNTESTNMWQTQLAIKAGTTEVWVRSRDGGSISDSSAWEAPWVRLARITDNIASATNADMVDGYHENSFLRYRGATYTDQEATLWSQIGIKQYNNALPDNLTGVYNYGSVISLPGFNSRFEIYASHKSSNGNGLYYRSGWGNDKKAWLKFIDSSNIGSQSVNYANSAGHANSAGNADTLGGIPRNYDQAPFGKIPSIGNDGVMEIGRYIDFHYDNSGSYDYSTRIQATGNYKNTVNLPSASGTLALTSYGGDDSTPIFLGYLNLDHGNDGTVSSSFYCLGYSVSFTYTRGGNYCRISIPDTTRLSFYINAAIASVNYSGGGMDTWTGEHRGDGAWWLHCYVSGWNEVRVKGFRNSSGDNDGWWGGNPLYSGSGSANRITVCIFGHVRYK